MSKALFGHVGGADPRLLAEVTRLRARVAELEAELDQLRESQAAALALTALDPARLEDDLRTLQGAEPVLA